MLTLHSGPGPARFLPARTPTPPRGLGADSLLTGTFGRDIVTKLTQVNANPRPAIYICFAAFLIREKTVGIEYIKWVFIAALICFSLYQIALAIGVTPVF